MSADRYNKAVNNMVRIWTMLEAADHMHVATDNHEYGISTEERANLVNALNVYRERFEAIVGERAGE